MKGKLYEVQLRELPMLPMTERNKYALAAEISRSDLETWLDILEINELNSSSNGHELWNDEVWIRLSYSTDLVLLFKRKEP